MFRVPSRVIAIDAYRQYRHIVSGLPSLSSASKLFRHSVAMALAEMSRPAALVVGAAMAAASLQRVAEAFVPGLPAAISDRRTDRCRTRTADHSSFPTRLHDIHEWRDTVFDVQSEDDSGDDNSFDPSPLREVCMLPFPINDIILQVCPILWCMPRGPWQTYGARQGRV